MVHRNVPAVRVATDSPPRPRRGSRRLSTAARETTVALGERGLPVLPGPARTAMSAATRVTSSSGNVRATSSSTTSDSPRSTPKTSGRPCSGRQRSDDPGPPSMPRTIAAHAPTSTTGAPEWRRTTTGRQAPPDPRVPAGQRGGLTQSAPRASDPRGHATSDATQAVRREATTSAASGGQAAAPPCAREATGTQPSSESTACSPSQATKAQPSAEARPARPQ
jgi:hypothetical protein